MPKYRSGKQRTLRTLRELDDWTYRIRIQQSERQAAGRHGSACRLRDAKNGAVYLPTCDVQA